MDSLEPIVRSLAAHREPEKSSIPLHLAAVYEDPLTRDWAMQACHCAARLVPKVAVHTTWWKIRFLEEPRIFETAVQAAARADVVCVSFQAADMAPPELSRWLDAWMKKRSANEAALVALVGATQQARPRLASTMEYLRAVAERVRLAFLPQEMKVPELDGASIQNSFRQWGIND